MTWQIRSLTLTPEAFDDYDRAVHALPGATVKPRSKGTESLMAAFGMARR